MIEYVVDPQARWVALVRAQASLVLPRSSAHRVEVLWGALEAPDAVASVLGVLTSDGLADVPPFALVADAGERRRVVVRGGFAAVVAGEEVTAAGVSTWVERGFTAGAPVEVRAPFSSAIADDDAWPIVEGVVPAGILRSQAEAPITAEAPVVPAPTAAVEHTIAPEHTFAPVDDTFAPADETIVAVEETMVPVDETVVRVDDAVDDATIVVSRPSPRAPAASPTEASAPDGDHDGLTISVAALRRMRRGAGSAASDDEGGAASASPTATAAAPAAAAAQPDPPAVPVTLRLPDGAEEALTGEIVLGRSPSVSRASGTKLPRLVTVGAGDPDISRNHVRVGLEGGTVVVTDLHSRNGTSVVQPGRAPVKLRAGEPTPVLAGTVVDLGGGCEITVVGG